MRFWNRGISIPQYGIGFRIGRLNGKRIFIFLSYSDALEARSLSNYRKSTKKGFSFVERPILRNPNQDYGVKITVWWVFCKLPNGLQSFAERRHGSSVFCSIRKYILPLSQSLVVVCLQKNTWTLQSCLKLSYPTPRMLGCGIGIAERFTCTKDFLAVSKTPPRRNWFSKGKEEKQSTYHHCWSNDDTVD